MSLEDRLAAGLLAQDWRETASKSSTWRRFGKFGRGAMYVMLAETPFAEPGELWFSELCQTVPDDPVVGPILQQVLAAGDKALASERPDVEAMLIELMYLGDGAPDA